MTKKRTHPIIFYATPEGAKTLSVTLVKETISKMETVQIKKRDQ
jgi:hypothetical protein